MDNLNTPVISPVKRRKNKPMVFVAAVLLASLSSPSLFFFEHDDYLVGLSRLLMIIIAVVGLAISYIYRKKNDLNSFAMAVAAISIFAYISLIFLSFKIVDTEYSQWNIFAFLAIPLFIPYYYGGGVLSGFLLGMHR